MKKALKWLAGIALTITVVLVLALVAFHWQAGQREVNALEAAAPKGGRYVDAGDVDIFVQEAGPAEGQAVLLVHGTGAWSEAWRPTMEALAAAGFRAFALDLPPFGFSHRPANADYSKAKQAERIVGVIAALELKRPILVGHSFGAGPTSEAAMRDPSRVRALVLVDAALGIDPSEGATAGAERPVSTMLRLLLDIEPLRHGLVAGFLTNPSFTRKLLQGFIDDPERATPEWVAVYQRPLGNLGTTAAVAQWLPSLIAASRIELSETAGAWRALKLPVTAIWGDRDDITPLDQAKRVTKLVARGRLTVMQGVGHIPQIEDGARFNRLLVELLRVLPE